MRFGPALTCVGLALLTGCGEPGSPPASPPASGSAPEPQWFKDVTDSVRLDFLHVAGTNYFMPDQMGSGIALLDYDNDGRLDVYCVQDGINRPSARNQLFHQEPDGTFRNASEGSGVDVNGRGMGVCAADANNDGWVDLLVTEYGAVRLFQNSGHGTFRELGPEAGLDNPRWAMPASFLDFDRDGWLDIAVGNYLDYDPTQECHDVHGQQDFCAPKVFGSTVTRLWRNVTRVPGGPPRFEDRTESAGLTRALGAALAVICVDFNGDGWVDMFCADDARPNRLFMNQRDGTFTEEAFSRGLAFNAMGVTAASMGTTLADVDGDGLWDMFIAHLAEEFHGYWKQGPRGLFIDQIASSGLQQQAWRGTGFGAVFADFNQDGYPDLAFSNGLVRRIVPGQTPVPPDVCVWWARYAQRAQIFRNDGNGRFYDLSPSQSDLCGQALVGRSLVLGDLDRDGAPDLILGNIGGRVRVYRNIASPRGHWVGLRLLDPQHGNRDAIGAEFTVRAGTRSWWGMIQPATSYMGSHDPAVTVGLGNASSVDAIEVSWPDGTKQLFTGIPIDRWSVLNKGQGNPQTASQ
jgi:hypothetical protein